MRFYVSGPRLLRGLIRPVISFGLEDFKRPAKRPGGAQVEGSFVYMIEGEQGRVKIGVSTKPRDRLATLHTASPFVLNFAFVGVTPGNGYDIEAAAHEMLADRRLNGEWFDATPAMVVAAVQSAAYQIKQKLLPIEPEQAGEILLIGAMRDAAAVALPKRNLARILWIVAAVLAAIMAAQIAYRLS